jgi:hypothetical protein
MNRCHSRSWVVLGFAILFGSQPLAFTQSSPTNPFTTFTCKLGTPPVWIRGCSAELTTGRHGSSRTCTSSPPPGFVMLAAQAVPTSVNNGDVTLSTLPAQSALSWNEDIKKAYGDLVDDVAEGEYTGANGAPVKNAVKLKMTEDSKSKSSEAKNFESTHQVALLRVNTNSRGRFDNRRSWSKGYAAMRVQCLSPGNMVDQLVAKYQLKLKPKPASKAPGPQLNGGAGPIEGPR